MRGRILIALAMTMSALALAACDRKTEAPAPAPVSAPQSAAVQSAPAETAHPFGGIKADTLIYFGINENWEGSALMMGSIGYSMSGDLSTISGAAPGGEVRVVVFGNLSPADTIAARKAGAKPNAAYRLTSAGRLEYLGDIDRTLDSEAVGKLCGDPRGATERISWEEFYRFLAAEQQVR